MTSTARFELFSFWRTSATYRVRVAFNLKGETPQEHNINLDAGGHRSEAFLKLNPMGAIPALVDHGPGRSTTPLTQSGRAGRDPPLTWAGGQPKLVRSARRRVTTRPTWLQVPLHHAVERLLSRRDFDGPNDRSGSQD